MKKTAFALAMMVLCSGQMCGQPVGPGSSQFVSADFEGEWLISYQSEFSGVVRFCIRIEGARVAEVLAEDCTTPDILISSRPITEVNGVFEIDFVSLIPRSNTEFSWDSTATQVDQNFFDLTVLARFTDAEGFSTFTYTGQMERIP